MSVVAEANTIGNPGTVMVHPKDTTATTMTAMVRTGRLQLTAFPAPAEFLDPLISPILPYNLCNQTPR